MKAIKRLTILAVVVCMLWGMTAVVMAASSEQTGETSTFTFTNEGAADDGSSGTGSGGTGTSGSGTDTSGSDTGTGTSGSGTGTSGSNGSGYSGSGGTGTGSAKTADVNTGPYVACAVIAGIGAVTLLGVSLGRRRRYGKEAR